MQIRAVIGWDVGCRTLKAACIWASHGALEGRVAVHWGSLVHDDC